MDQSEEEKAAELVATQVVKEDEVRAAVIEEFGFDEIDDAERIDKLVAKEVENHKKLSSAIGQKIKHRAEAEALKNDPRFKTVTPPSQDGKSSPEDIGKVVAQALEQRDLEGLEYPEELKKEIQRIAAVQGISVKQAARDPYIVFKIDEYKKEQDVQDATISRTNHSSGKKAYTFDSPPDSDLNTEEGRKQWTEYKASMVKQGF